MEGGRDAVAFGRINSPTFVELLPPSSLSKYWARKGIAEWLVTRVVEDTPTLVDMD